MTKTRPGGRTAQTREAVFAAADALLLAKDPGAISMVELAERAGLAATSLYRRWGDVRALLTEVAVDRLQRDVPLPDTGGLEGDLKAWLQGVAARLSTPGGSSFFRVYVGAFPRTVGEARDRAAVLGPRMDELATMLARAEARGEATPTVEELADHLLAPLYMRALFGAPADEALADALVARLLAASRRAI